MSFLKKRFGKVIIWLSICTGFVVIFLFILIFSVYSGWLGKLPSTQDLTNIDQDDASLVYAADGTLMGKYYITNRQTINNESISPYVRQALIATEDSRFFEHHGIDVIGMGRVIFKSILLGNIAQGGGSTISQQLAKNLFGRTNYRFLSIPINKIREIILASRIEDHYSKEEILTLYLNTVAFGEEVFGIEAAAWRFFNKPSSMLNIPESATLIGTLAANTAYNPRLNPGQSVERRNLVLNRMVVQGFIKEIDAKQYYNQPIELDYNIMDINQGIAPYYREYIRKQANKILKEKYGDEYHLETDGLKVYTTLNTRIQSYAEQAINTHMKKLQEEFDTHWKNNDPWYQYPEVFEVKLKQTTRYQNLLKKGLNPAEVKRELKKANNVQLYTHDGEIVVEKNTIDSLRYYLRMLNTGLFAMNPQTGEILAWVGGISHKYKPYDHVLAERQVGSTFKPIVYANSLMNGTPPCQMYPNKEITYEEFDNWTPTNSDGFSGGYYSLKGGLVNSSNTITAQLIINEGPESVVELAEKMGINAFIPAVPSIALGSAEISLFEMVEAYTVFANQGIMHSSYGITKIENSQGEILYEYEDKNSSVYVLDSTTSILINHMLQGVVDHGTGRNLRNIYGVQSSVAGKTGTTQKNADGWFIAYTPNIVIGTWTGAELPVIHFRSIALGSGAHQALPSVGIVLNKIEEETDLKSTFLTSFSPLPDSLSYLMDCPDFTYEKPDRNVFEKIIDIFDSSDSTKTTNEKKNKVPKARKIEDDKKEKEGLFKRIGKIFKKKGNQ